MLSRNMHLIARSALSICGQGPLSSASPKPNCRGLSRLLQVIHNRNRRGHSRRESTGTPGCGRRFAIPAFATLLAVVSYQNLSTIPSLRKAASEPRLLPSVSFHAGTRGSAHTSVGADRTHGAALSIELPQDSGYASYAFELYDPQGKQLWTRSITASQAGSSGDGTVFLSIPGEGLVQGSYALTISGTDSKGTRTEIDRRVLDIHFDE